MQPSLSSILTLEGGGGDGGRGRNGGTGVNGGDTGAGNMGGSGSDAGGLVEVCLELTSGNLQRNVSVNVFTVSSTG